MNFLHPWESLKLHIGLERRCTHPRAPLLIAKNERNLSLMYENKIILNLLLRGRYLTYARAARRVPRNPSSRDKQSTPALDQTAPNPFPLLFFIGRTNYK